MPPNTLRVHTEYVLVKLVDPKSCALSHERRDWRIFPSPSVQCRNCGGGDRWCRHLSSFRAISLNRTVTYITQTTDGSEKINAVFHLGAGISSATRGEEMTALTPREWKDNQFETLEKKGCVSLLLHK
ncbi:uncharacterized protein TNCV_3256141 [Trichonephila clavipes]|nr:uncharacterized protein TNCV_3256141 [Trichonephila clavipes]